MLVLSFAAGSIPFSGIAARVLAGVDLRNRGSGTVSGTGLYEVAGFGPLAVAGSLDVAKGAVGPLLAGHDRPWLAAAATSATLVAHNWNPFLRGAGGRGVSPALGATLVAAPEGTALLAAGLGIGRLARQSALGTIVATAALPGLLGRRRGLAGRALGLGIALPMVLKRIAGNRPLPAVGRARTALARLLFDRDTLLRERSSTDGSTEPREEEGA